MRALAILFLLAVPLRAQDRSAPMPASSAPVVSADTTPARGTVQSVKARLEGQDPQGALDDARKALARDGKAEDWAALADAERALGRWDQAIADYGKAAALDPKYLAERDGLIAQRSSEARPAGGDRVKIPVRSYALVAGVAALLIVFGVTAYRRGVWVKRRARPRKPPP